MRKKDRQELETTIDDLRASIKNLRGQLVNAKVLRGRHELYTHGSSSPISLINLKDQIECIKNFLGIRFVEEPSIPAKSMMKKIQSTEED